MTTPVPDYRLQAAQLANQTMAAQGQGPQVMQRWINFWYSWLTFGLAARAAIVVNVQVRNRAGDITYSDTSAGGHMAPVSMTVDDTVTFAASETDDHGDPVTSDALALADSANGAVLTFTQSGNTWTGTPVAEGTTTVTISDPSVPALTAFTSDVTVGAGAASSISATATVNTGANAAPPPAPAAPVA